MNLSRALGCRWSGNVLRWRGVEWSPGWGLALEIINFGEGRLSLHLCLIFGQCYIGLPFRGGAVPSGECLISWGVSWRWDHYSHTAIHLHWGARTKLLHLPWQMVWVRKSYLLRDGMTWAHDLNRTVVPPLGTGVRADRFAVFRDLPLWRQTLPYRYVLRSGAVQVRTATITVDEFEFRPQATRWLPWPRSIRRSIAIQFNDEVGERAGSWKGGCLGCNYDLRRGETPAECLRRMEIERTF